MLPTTNADNIYCVPGNEQGGGVGGGWGEMPDIFEDVQLQYSIDGVSWVGFYTVNHDDFISYSILCLFI